MRLQTLYLVNVHLKNAINDVRKFMPFPWDEVKIYVPTEADWDYFQKLGEKWQAKQLMN